MDQPLLAVFDTNLKEFHASVEICNLKVKTFMSFLSGEAIRHFKKAIYSSFNSKLVTNNCLLCILGLATIKIFRDLFLKFVQYILHAICFIFIYNAKQSLKKKMMHIKSYLVGLFRGTGRSIIGGGGGGGQRQIFIYFCSQTVKTIVFKILISISKEINWA